MRTNFFNKEDNINYYNIVKPILENDEFKKRNKFLHHGDRTVYEHSIMVSIKSYKIAKFLHLDISSIAIGALLHDFYTSPWQENKNKDSFFKQHGFVHASEALNNSKIFFGNYINDKVSDIIVRHMFPLNILPPKYLESWIVTIVDKYVSLEIFKNPLHLHKYLGIKKGGK